MTYQATGISKAEIKDYAGKVATAVQVSQSVYNDPYLTEVLCELDRYQLAEVGMPAPPACARTIATPAQIEKGAGLNYAATPIRIAVFGERYPGLIPAMAIGGLALIFFAGVATGRARR